MKDCLFCQIHEGNIPAYKIYETESVLAFLDRFPVVQGHTLIIPKIHSQDYLSLSSKLWSEIGEVTQKIAKAHLSLGADGTNLFVTQGKAAGQTVFHTHWHCVPRYNNDHLVIGQAGKEASETDLKIWQDKLSQIIKS